MKDVILASALAGSIVTSSAVAQQMFTKTVEVRAGGNAALGSFANLKPDCSPGPHPEVKLIGAPKVGVVAVMRRTGRLGSGTRCPSASAIAQIVEYRAKPVSGEDEVTFQVTLPTGGVVVHRVTIKITDGPPSSPRRSAPSAKDI